MVSGIKVLKCAVLVTWAIHATSSYKPGQAQSWSLKPNATNSFANKTLGDAEPARLLTDPAEHYL